MNESLKLQRNLLGSIDLADLEKEETEEERRAHSSAIFAVYPRLESDLKKLLHAQLLFASNEAETWEQVLFGRGTFNGLSLFLEHLKVLQSEHIENSRGKEDFDHSSPISEV